MSNNKGLPVKQSLKKVRGKENTAPSAFAKTAVTSSKLPASNVSAIKSRVASSTSKTDTSYLEEQTFSENFERVPIVHIYSDRDVDKQFRIYHDILKNKNEDWEKRVDCLKKIRSLIVAGAAVRYVGFHERLSKLVPAFHLALEDLRSKVVCEACITVAFLSKSLKNKVDHFIESLLDSILRLVLKTQRVFVSVALTCVNFILRYTHAPRLIPIIANHLNSKSSGIRRAASKFIHLILQTWHKHVIEKFAAIIWETVRKGICDADAETRSNSRDAYVSFALHFPQEAERLKDSVDSYYRKSLASDSCALLRDRCSSRATHLREGQRENTRTITTRTMKTKSSIGLQSNKENHRRFALQPPCHSGVPFFSSTSNLPKPKILTSQIFQAPDADVTSSSELSHPTKSTSAFSWLSFGPVSSNFISSPSEESGSSMAPSFTEHRMCGDLIPLRDVDVNVVSYDTMSLPRQKERTEPSIDGLNNTNLSVASEDMNYESFCDNLINCPTRALPTNEPSECNDTDASKALRSYLDELSRANESGTSSRKKYDIVLQLIKFIEDCSSGAIITHFRPLLARIMTMTLPSKPILVRKAALNLLQLIIVKNEIVNLLKEFSDLVIAQVVSLCADPSRDVVEASKNCAIALSTYLPAKNVMRIVVPIISAEESVVPVKLICIEMLTYLISRSDNEVILENVNLIVPVLRVASDDMNSVVRRAALACLEAL